MQTIKFWKTRDPYGCFSNFSRHPIVVDNVVYQTTEHYYQALKLTDENARRQVILAANPKESKVVAYSYPQFFRKDWDAVKNDVMLDALRRKVEQNPEVRTTLVNTGDALLVEDSPYDYYWGCGNDGSGENWLGKLLMVVRSECQSSPFFL